MKMKISGFVIVSFFLLVSCGGKKESAASIAQKWCELNAKELKDEGPAKEGAEMARDKFEEEMGAKYKDNEEFMKQVEQEVEKCEDASEGR